jgi:hypothetical protein
MVIDFKVIDFMVFDYMVVDYMVAERIEDRSAVGGGCDEEPAAVGFNQRERLPRRKGNALDESEMSARARCAAKTREQPAGKSAQSERARGLGPIDFYSLFPADLRLHPEFPSLFSRSPGLSATADLHLSIYVRRFAFGDLRSAIHVRRFTFDSGPIRPGA